MWHFNLDAYGGVCEKSWQAIKPHVWWNQPYQLTITESRDVSRIGGVTTLGLYLPVLFSALQDDDCKGYLDGPVEAHSLKGVIAWA